MNIDQALRALETRISYPPEPDVSTAVIGRISAAPVPWWYRPRLAAVGVAIAVIVLVVGLVPAARDQVTSWLGIRGVTVETLPLPTAAPATGPPATTTTVDATVTTSAFAPIRSGLGEGLVLGQEIVSATVGSLAGFEPLYPEIGLPDRQFVDGGGRAWMLYSTHGFDLPETQVPGVGMIVTQFEGDSPGITKQIATDEVELFDLGDGLFGLWLPGPHELILPNADGSAVNGRSAGNTLLWEQGDLTIRIETALSKEEAIAIAQTFS